MMKFYCMNCNKEGKPGEVCSCEISTPPTPSQVKLYGLFTCDTCGKQLGATCCTNKYQGQFCSVSCAEADEFKKSGGVAPTPPTPSQVLTGILDTLKEELSKGSKDAQQVASLRASVRILEKQKLVLKNEAKRFYNKVRDLDNLCAEQIEYIEELERKVIQEDDNPSYIAQLHAILDKKDKEIKELEEFKVGYQEVLTNQQRLYLENRELQHELTRLREEARQCPQTHKF